MSSVSGRRTPTSDSPVRKRYRREQALQAASPAPQHPLAGVSPPPPRPVLWGAKNGISTLNRWGKNKEEFKCQCSEQFSSPVSPVAFPQNNSPTCASGRDLVTAKASTTGRPLAEKVSDWV